MSKKMQCIRWAVDLSCIKLTFNEMVQAISCIQPEEKERLMQFYFREDFDSSLVGRLLMRKFVSEQTKQAYDKIQFARDVRGKPYLVDPLSYLPYRLSFNVSHQGSFSVLAGIAYEAENCDENIVNSDIGIGVDIMKLEYTGGKPLSEFFRLMTKNFSDQEWKYIRKQSNETEQLKAFMRHWCLKESYVKNIGVGITIDLQKIDFNIKSDNLEKNKIIVDTTVRINNCLLENWSFEEHMLDEQHCLAIAFKGIKSDVDVNNCEILSFNDLLKDCLVVTEPDESYCKRIVAKKYKKSKK